MNRLTREEAAEYLGCSKSKFYRMEKAGMLDGTYYQLGLGKRTIRLYITHKLDEWMLAGGEPAALARKPSMVQNHLLRFG